MTRMTAVRISALWQRHNLLSVWFPNLWRLIGPALRASPGYQHVSDRGFAFHLRDQVCNLQVDRMAAPAENMQCVFSDNAELGSAGFEVRS